MTPAVVLTGITVAGFALQLRQEVREANPDPAPTVPYQIQAESFAELQQMCRNVIGATDEEVRGGIDLDVLTKEYPFGLVIYAADGTTVEQVPIAIVPEFFADPESGRVVELTETEVVIEVPDIVNPTRPGSLFSSGMLTSIPRQVGSIRRIVEFGSTRGRARLEAKLLVDTGTGVAWALGFRPVDED